ncbi:hypothetical protein [Sutcliffiella horikoshii]|uniref:hypothetical protein n=1 Tax=Sutcliffiella horikoshii TaxID=79883 RepID=UPI003CEF0D06
MNRKYASGGFLFYLGGLFLFLFLLNGGYVLLPYIIIISLIFATYLVYFYKPKDEREGEREKGVHSTGTGVVFYNTKNEVEGHIGCGIAWIIGIVVAIWIFNNF